MSIYLDLAGSAADNMLHFMKTNMVAEGKLPGDHQKQGLDKWSDLTDYAGDAKEACQRHLVLSAKIAGAALVAVVAIKIIASIGVSLIGLAAVIGVGAVFTDNLNESHEKAAMVKCASIYRVFFPGSKSL